MSRVWSWSVVRFNTLYKTEILQLLDGLYIYEEEEALRSHKELTFLQVRVVQVRVVQVRVL